MGLINRLADDAPALAAMEASLVAKLAALDPAAVRLTKEMHRAACNMPLGDALAMGKQLNALLLASGRIDEASRVFAARRK
jgi:enoyl-CoA hydratase/carnithine racemase